MTASQNSSVVEQQFRKLRVVGSIPTSGSKFLKTKYANLVRYIPSGTYFCRASVGGRLLRRSLKTQSIELAKIKLDRLIEAERARRKAKAGAVRSVAAFAEIFLTKVRSSGVKPRSVDYRVETWGMLSRTCPELPPKDVAEVSISDCERAGVALRGKYSAGRYNGILETLRGIFKAALSAGACLADPTKGLERASVPIVAPKLPSNAEFKAMLRQLNGHGATRGAGFAVALMAYTGLRVTEARSITPADVDLKGGWILVRDSIAKNGEERRIPIIAEARPLVKRLLAGEVVINPARALKTVSKGTMTPHKLRHLFATSCLECGVDYRTVAAWVGHKDRGITLMRRYSHLRDEHAKKMAKKVRFR